MALDIPETQDLDKNRTCHGSLSFLSPVNAPRLGQQPPDAFFARPENITPRRVVAVL